MDNIRILILEDSAIDAELIEFELAEAEIAFTSKRTVNEKEFRQELTAFSPDLILSDYNLPQYNGALALIEAKRLHPGVPFILVTGAFDDVGEGVSDILAMGADDCIFKSRLDSLAPAIHKVFGMTAGI
jgi:DNA-binding response OmpR family regulator